MCGINRVPCKSRKVLEFGKKTFPGMESLNHLFSSISTKNVYIVIEHSVIVLNNNTSVQRLFSSSVLKIMLKVFFETSGKVLEFHFQLRMRILN